MSDTQIPDDDQIRLKMEEMMKVVDLETMSTKQFIAALSAHFGGVDLSSKKKYIKATITEIIDSMTQGNEDDSEDESVEEEDAEEDENEIDLKPKKRGGGGGLSAVKEISDKLADFLGSGKFMARTAIVKELWTYIKENNLQNPSDKRQILLDEKMKAVFGVDCFTMFSMNKFIGEHVEPFKPIDSSTDGAAEPKKRKAKASPTDADGVAKKQSSGTQVPYRLSDPLVAVVGKSVLPRPQVTQALWVYIRENDLQNPNDKREIICDEKLSKVMGGKKKVTMFSMNQFITPHLLEKVDRSELELSD